MITLYGGRHGKVAPLAADQQEPVRPFDGAAWVDVLLPTDEERETLVSTLGMDLPSHKDMHEIEASSRLFASNGAVYMTTPVLAHADGDEPVVGPITFILTPETLVTLRYIEPRSFDLFVERAERDPALYRTAFNAFVALLDTLIDRMADVLEMVGGRIDALSRQVFVERGSSADRPDLHEILQGIGRAGDLIAKARDSLAGFSRMIAFIGGIGVALKSEHKAGLKIATRDIRSLTTHADFQAQRTTFLLDASLGLINNEQNNILRIFSVAATGFLPPTLIASIYGMNFDVMPELHWSFGYPLALGLMIASAVLPLWYFRRRGWL